jgi:HTH-type transcriptional regulator/antitoxin HipB
MPVRALDVKTIGEQVRATRTASGIDQATAAGLAGVGIRFLGDLERGRPNLRITLVLQVLHRLGIELWLAPRSWQPKADS